MRHFRIIEVKGDDKKYRSYTGNKLTVNNSTDNKVDIYNVTGLKVKTLVLENNSTNLDLNKGLYIVKSGNLKSKIML